MLGVIKEYKNQKGCYTPPSLPKRTDSIARNIDKYFNSTLIDSCKEEKEKNDLGIF